VDPLGGTLGEQRDDCRPLEVAQSGKLIGVGSLKKEDARRKKRGEGSGRARTFGQKYQYLTTLQKITKTR